MAAVSAGCWECTASCLVHEKALSKEYIGGQGNRYFVSSGQQDQYLSVIIVKGI